MRVLALDAATEACSVALLDGERCIERFHESGKSHAQHILGMVDSVLAEAQISLSMLDGLAASVGPGSFTGVRISVSVGQGLAFGAGLAVVPVMTLEALALREFEQGASRALCCLDARMGEVYWGCFAADRVEGVRSMGPAGVGAPELVVLPQGDPLPACDYRGIGRGFASYPQLLAATGVQITKGASEALPRAREMVRLGALRLAAGQGIDPAELLPRYLREKVALTEAERRQPKPR